MRFLEHLLTMKRSALTFALTCTALSLCLSAPAAAQLYLDFRSDKPSVELDMDVLKDMSPRAPAAQEEQTPAAPVVEQQPLPLPPDTENAVPAVPPPHVQMAPRKLNKPLFAAPVSGLADKSPNTPQAPAAPTAAKPAARRPYNPYLTTPVMPSRTPQAVIPVQPQNVKSNAEVKPVSRPRPKPPLRALPEEVISEAEIDSLNHPHQEAPHLPARKPVSHASHTDHDTLTADEKAAPVTTTRGTEEPVPPSAHKPAPDIAPRAVLKQAEVTMPISETEYEQIAENMETVPVQVAIAPPKPVYAPKAASAADLTLEFDRASESLSPAAKGKLKNVIEHMNTDGDAQLQIRAYATGDDGSKSSARSKSLTRATEIRSFLMDNGIRPTRVIVRALGQETDRKPLDRVDLSFVK